MTELLREQHSKTGAKGVQPLTQSHGSKVKLGTS